MGQQDINSATVTTTITGSDSVFISKNDNALQKIDYDLLAKAIIEQYTGSTLGGSARSLKTAIDALNSNLRFKSLFTSASETESLWEKNIILSTGYYHLIAFTRSAVPSSASEYFFLSGGNRSAILSPIIEGASDNAPILTNECVLKLKNQNTSTEVFYRIEKTM